VCVCVEAVVSRRLLYFESYYTRCTLVKTCTCVRRKYVTYILHCNVLDKQPNSINTTEWMGLFKLSWPILHGDQREGLSYRPAPSTCYAGCSSAHGWTVVFKAPHFVWNENRPSLHMFTSHNMNPVFTRLRTSLCGEHIVSWQLETAVMQS
jgi:hypothetical protein